MISEEEVIQVVMHGEVIEDYPNDERGHSCLMAGPTQESRIIHVVCSPKDQYLAIITAYVPDLTEWDESLKKRRGKS